MTMKDDIGDRMKGYESESDTSVALDKPIIVRIDGKRFSRYTAKFKKPFDDRITDAMINVTEALIKQTHAHLGYTQSDEITLIFLPKEGKTNIMFEGRVQKIVSVFASIATVAFAQHIGEHSKESAYFDARVWNVPDEGEAANTLLWRVMDAERNAVSSIFRHRVGHAQMQNKNVKEMLEELEKQGIDIEEYPSHQRSGTIVARELSIDQIAIRTKSKRYSASIYRKMTFGDKIQFLDRAFNKTPIEDYDVIRPVVGLSLMRIACAKCNGRGYIQRHPHWDNGDDGCDVCDGRGFVNVQR